MVEDRVAENRCTMCETTASQACREARRLGTAMTQVKTYASALTKANARIRLRNTLSFKLIATAGFVVLAIVSQT